MKYWGWQKNYTPEVYENMFRGYDKLFRGLLPAKYRNSMKAVFTSILLLILQIGDVRSHGAEGDSHNWGVWYGKKTFESLDTDLPRIRLSEFGFQSFPEMKTIATFAAPEDYQIESESDEWASAKQYW